MNGMEKWFVRCWITITAAMIGILIQLSIITYKINCIHESIEKFGAYIEIIVKKLEAKENEK